jgi:hypothetical protein
LDYSLTSYRVPVVNGVTFFEAVTEIVPGYQNMN